MWTITYRSNINGRWTVEQITVVARNNYQGDQDSRGVKISHLSHLFTPKNY